MRVVVYVVGGMVGIWVIWKVGGVVVWEWWGSVAG